MNTAEKNKNQNQKWIIAVLFVLFALPFSLSWFLFNFTDFGRGEGSASHGQLINPPRLIPDMALSDPTGRANSERLYGKWNLVYLLAGNCDQACENNMYRMRQLRLAMGKHAHRVQRVLISFGDQHVSLDDQQLDAYRGQLLLAAADVNKLHTPELFELKTGDKPLSAGRIYIIDPRGYLMMSYEQDADPSGIIKDLKQLLRYSGTG